MTSRTRGWLIDTGGGGVSATGGVVESQLDSRPVRTTSQTLRERYGRRATMSVLLMLSENPVACVFTVGPIPGDRHTPTRHVPSTAVTSRSIVKSSRVAITRIRPRELRRATSASGKQGV